MRLRKKLERKFKKLVSQKWQEIIILISFMIGIAMIGISSKVEAYDNDNNHNQALYDSREFHCLSLVNGNIHNVGDTKNNGVVVNEATTKSRETGYKELYGQNTQGLCQLDSVVCPGEETTTIREISAYNLGDPNQNDSTPCITASGQNGCELLEKGIKICAANFVPLQTKINIENYGECLVIDRLNARYKNRVDIGMKLSEKQRALDFGIQRLSVSEL